MTQRRSISPALRAKIIARHEGRCVECGTDKGPLELDHEVALCLGGADDETNLVPKCRECHARKSASDNSRRAKADRIRRKREGSWPQRGPKLKGRGFRGWRSLSGEARWKE